MKNVLILFILFFSSFLLANDKAVTIRVLVEDLYPLHYMKNGEIIGSSIDLIEKIIKKSGFNYTIEMQPWARAYNTTLHNKNTLLISIARTKQREKLFTWIGPVIKFNYFLYGLSNTTIDSEMPIAEINNYRIAVIRQTAIHHYLKSKNLNNYQLVGSTEQAIRMLTAHRVDLVSGIDGIFMKHCYRLKLACQSITPLYKFKNIVTDIHIAMNKSTDKEIIKRIKTAFKKVKKQPVK